MKNKKRSIIDRIWESARKAIGYKEIVQQKSLDIRTLKELTVLTTSTNVEILTHTEPRIDVILETYENGPILSINQKSDSVDIRAQNDGGSSFSVFRRIPTCHLKVMVPSDVAKLWQITADSAKVTAGNLLADTIHTRTTSGSIEIKDIKANKVNVKVSSGKIKATNFMVDQLAFSASSGHVVLDTLHGDVRGNATSGAITLKNIHGENLDVKASSGRIRLQDVQVNHAVSRATSGNVELVRCRINSLETNASSGNLKINDFLGSVKGSSNSGNINLTFTKLTNENSIDLKAQSGNITVNTDSKHLNTVFDIQTRSGQIITNIPIQFENKSNRGLSGVIGNGDNQVRLQANSGTIRLQEIR
ncbi:DUF4097 domain-containing protein [Ornithinibacillus salinisoli]|uniref:DUF4097 domain-containing protein n=1 Tax=Ornithinibacillus salinisoli TaxID=1848459 RepID=A0ABW4VWP5_9BACI